MVDGSIPGRRGVAACANIKSTLTVDDVGVNGNGIIVQNK